MKSTRSQGLILIIACLGVSGLIAQTQEAQKPVLRAKRPSFQKKHWDGIFFENLFTEGLRGPRPPDLMAGPARGTSKPSSAIPASSTEAVPHFAWPQLVTAAVIEDEVKRLQQRLSQEVTTAAKFKTDHAQIRQTLSLLSMLFAVISQYDGQVRWRDSALSAQLALGQAAANARTDSPQAFASAKRCVDDLAGLVRGEPFSNSQPNAPITDWSAVVDRVALMRRLDEAFTEKLKPLTSTQSAVQTNLESILHEAEVVAMIGRVLVSPEMLDADADTYSEHSRAMTTLGRELSAAIGSNSLDVVSEKVSLLGQACDQCHADWR